MGRGEPIGLWLLPVLCAIGFATAFYTLVVSESRQEGRLQLTQLSAEIGVGGGLLFWLILRWLGFGSGGLISGFGQAAVRAAIWAVVAWPLTMWRLERRLGIPYHRSYDTATLICGVMLLLFFIVASAAIILPHI
jgi:hypothetical protein